MKTRDILLGAGGLLVAVGIGAFIARRNRKTIPEGAEAVKNFDAEKFMGKWYEVARFDFFWEKNLSSTTADYSLNSDGTVMVVNCGYDTKKKKWHSAVGKAWFVGSSTVGMLEVSFFGPFYSGYNVVAVDDSYKHALVFGRNTSYMWLLSRDR